VVAEPGMGKSSTTTQVAWHTKERDPTSWVVRINWNDHTTKLQKIDAETFNLDTLVEFLCIAAFPESKYTHINRRLLKQTLQSSGNVTVLMDGFDEISPYHADKAAVILSELMKTEVRRLWVTSRPVVRERLEKQLSVIAYDMKKLAYTSQEDMLIDLWKHKAGEEELTKSKLLRFIQFLSRNLIKFVYDDNFTGCPLYITMIATVYEMEVETCLNSADWIKPRFDLVNLYEKFVERKIDIYLTEKQKVDITNCSVLDDLEDSNQRLLMNFEKCALVAILPPPMLESLHNKKIEDEIKSFLERVEKGKDKTGIVMNVVEGKPQFVHRTFAEYFTARWFSENFQSNRSVLEDIIFDDEYKFLRDMFDRMLAKDCPMHCAVLDCWNIRIIGPLRWDEDIVETLLKEGCDANAVDKGGRTVMHITVIHNIYYKVIDLLYHSGVPMENKDRVLQWTPLQYAIKSEEWQIVEMLLERNVDRSGLDMIRQRAHDRDYIDKIILISAHYGYVLLLEFIRSISVNIHQACSMDFPSPLHVAIQGRQLQVVRWLIKHGADCNTRYRDDQTPLYYAVTQGPLDVVRALVEEGGASLDVRDDCGRTVIDWANDYRSDPKYREFLNWYVGVAEQNETLKYLQERGCKQTSSVQQNNDT
jgi:ankyrin repeat protein